MGRTNTKFYYIDQSTYTKYLKKHGEVRCQSQWCNREVNVGDPMIAIRKGKHTKIYDRECARKLNII